MTNKTSKTETRSGLRFSDFERTLNQKEIKLYVLKNKSGLEVCVTNYGAIIVSISTPDGEGKIQNIVLGGRNIDEVIDLSKRYFMGAVVGRIANRTQNGSFFMNKKQYHLACNCGKHSLHGGFDGLYQVVWDVDQIKKDAIYLSYNSEDGEAGFPGNVLIGVCYNLTDDNKLIIKYLAKCSEITPLNITSHSYFNLRGTNKVLETIDEDILQTNTPFYLPTNSETIPTGEILSVKNTPFDFLTPKSIHEALSSTDEQIRFGLGIDHYFIVNDFKRTEALPIAQLKDPISKRTLKVYTSEPGIIIYTGNHLSSTPGELNIDFPPRTAICFETQHFPDSMSYRFFPSILYSPKRDYKQMCIYEFGICSEGK